MAFADGNFRLTFASFEVHLFLLIQLQATRDGVIDGRAV